MQLRMTSLMASNGRHAGSGATAGHLEWLKLLQHFGIEPECPIR
jgi:hypothetical protein